MWIEGKWSFDEREGRDDVALHLRGIGPLVTFHFVQDIFVVDEVVDRIDRAMGDRDEGRRLRDRLFGGLRSWRR